MAEHWHPPTSPKQDELREMCKRKKFVLANGCRLSTKCVSPDTLVYTDSGLVPIGSLGTAGDGLFSPIDRDVVSLGVDNLYLAKANQFYNSGTKPAISVRTEMGYEITGSKQHPLWSECGGEIKYRTTQEIAELTADGIEVWLPLVREHFGGWPAEFAVARFDWFSGQERRAQEASDRIGRAVKAGAKTIAEIKKAAKTAHGTIVRWFSNRRSKKTCEVVVDSDIGYLIGLFVGDGCYSEPVMRQFMIRFSSADPETVQFVTSVIESRFPHSFVKHEKTCDYSVQSSSFRAFLFALGMAGKYAHEKTVPEVIFQSPKSVVVSFLKGLFDTDGMVCKSRTASYCSTSALLAKQVQGLLLGLGIRSSRRFAENDYRGAWLIRPRTEDGFFEKVGFRLARKRDRAADRKWKYRLAWSAYPPSLIEVLKQLHQTRSSRGVGKLSRQTHAKLIIPVFKRNVSLSKKRLLPLFEALKCGDASEVSPYWVKGKIWWDRVKSCDPTECSLVDISVPGPQNFVGNGFVNHNTVGCLNCVAEHAWSVTPANIGLITLSQTVGFDSGVWQDLTKVVLPAWIGGDFGMKWVREPYIMGNSKMPTCEVTNQFGGSTVIQLHSCQNEQETENRFKPRRFSMIYVPELATFRRMKTYITWTETLRMIGLPSDRHLLLACTNPSDEGEASFIYHLFFELLEMEEKDLDPMELPLKKHIARVDFVLDDNIFDTEDRKNELKAKYAHDKDLFDRYILGKWVTSSEDALFHEVFREGVHVVGEKETPGNKDPEMLVPSDECSELITGWDPGGRNCAAVIAEKQMVKAGLLWPELFQNGDAKIIDAVPGMPGKHAAASMSADKEFPVFKFIDELILVAEDFRMEDFVEQFVAKMDFWEKLMGKTGRVAWRHWSDRSAFEATLMFADRYIYELIYEISDGRISLMSERGNRGAVSARVDLWRKLLWEQRVWFSAAKCPQLIQMNKSIKKGTTIGAVIQKGSPFKHAFDAPSYLQASEAFDELAKSIRVNIRRKRGENTLVSVGY